MDPRQHEMDSNSSTARERHLLRLYGKLPAKGDLLHHQLERRKYFDSGDFALSEANKPSSEGAVQTGREHPLRENISNPSSPVPSDSNVKQNANRELQGSESTNVVKEASHLHQEMSTENKKVCNNMPTGFDSLNPAKEEIPVGPGETSKT